VAALAGPGLVGALALLLLSASCDPAAAQPSAKVPHVGYLSPGASSDPARLRRFEAFRQGLRALGYVEGQNVVVEARWAEGRYERYPALATDLVNAKVDVIVTVGGAATQAAQHATATVPIVMTVVFDPLGGRLVSTLARPGANVTGLSLIPLVGKQLEALKEVVPKATRMTVLSNPDNPASATQLREAEAAARSLGVRLRALQARGPQEIDGAFATMVSERTPALLALPDAVFTNQVRQIAELAIKNRLPSIYGLSEYTEVRRVDGVQPQHSGSGTARGHLRGQDSQGRQAGRSAHRAADQARSRHQPQDGQGARPHDPARADPARGPGDRVARANGRARVRAGSGHAEV
jgi:putative ABC transport system substrate-binding protein